MLIILQRKLAYEYDQMHFTILEEMKSTLPKSLWTMHLSLDRHKDNENDDSDENDESNERDETVKNESLESGRDLHKFRLEI